MAAKKTTKKASAEAKPVEVIRAFKGFDRNMQCRGYQYAVGQTYTHTGNVKACDSGFHSCENPLDVLDYYPLDCYTRFAVVNVSGKIDREGNKLASASIAIEAELKLPEFIGAAIDYVKSACKEALESGNSSKLAASGDYSQLAASGYYSKLAASGNSSKLSASGYYSQLAASGDSSKLAASGYYSQLAASGHSSKLAASGHYSKLAASGDSSQLAASGNSSKLAASGDYSQLAASGDSSQLAASGYYSQLAADGENSIAISASEYCKAKAGDGGCIVLRWTKDKKPRVSVAYVGEDGIKADTWYSLDADGKFVEVQQ